MNAQTINKVALITGANKGLGFGIARQLGKQGITVLIAARNESRGKEAIDKLRSENIDTHFIKLDISDRSRIESAHNAIALAEQPFKGNYSPTVRISQDTTNPNQVEVEGDLAFSSFTADAIVESDGERTVMPVFYTLGWRKTPNGWRIIHEHGSNLITEDSPVRQAQ